MRPTIIACSLATLVVVLAAGAQADVTGVAITEEHDGSGWLVLKLVPGEAPLRLKVTLIDTVSIGHASVAVYDEDGVNLGGLPVVRLRGQTMVAGGAGDARTEFRAPLVLPDGRVSSETVHHLLPGRAVYAVLFAAGDQERWALEVESDDAAVVGEGRGTEAVVLSPSGFTGPVQAEAAAAGVGAEAALDGRFRLDVDGVFLGRYGSFTPAGLPQGTRTTSVEVRGEERPCSCYFHQATGPDALTAGAYTFRYDGAAPKYGIGIGATWLTGVDVTFPP